MSIVRRAPNTLSETLKRLGNVPTNRIRMQPAPGTATERDVVRIHDREDRLYELVEGVLVEKAKGIRESFLAGVLIQLINNFLDKQSLGIALGSDGMVRLKIGLVRIPDVCFISRKRLPGRGIPDEAISPWIPEIAIEVISKSNTKREMRLKCTEYFTAGVRLVWFVYPKTRTIDVYTAPHELMTLSEEDFLEGGDVLPGFRLSLHELFGKLD
jgi:Uma2 family endonuclease